MYIERARMRGGEKLDGWMDVFCPGFNLPSQTHTHTLQSRENRRPAYTSTPSDFQNLMKCELCDRFIVKRLAFRLSLYFYVFLSFLLTLLCVSIGHAKKKEMCVSKLCVDVWCVVVSSARYYNLKNPFFFLGCQLNFIVSFSIVSWRLDIWYSLRCHMCVVQRGSAAKL